MEINNSLKARSKAFEARIKDKLQELLREFKKSISKCPNKSQHYESFNLMGSWYEKYEHGQDTGYTCMEFYIWEDRDPTGWISRTEKFFSFLQDSKGIQGGNSFYLT
ncbi:hypothetical protein BHM03_00007751 [Ensete ventricosum]|nr:hypothetical protein BHM03_00007751 [Ensete ventricosum]